MKKIYSLILVRPEGAVNIGLCARAAKNFGVHNIALVQPACNHLSKEAMGYAAHAEDILEKAKVYSTLPEAVRNFDLILGFSRREGQYRKRDLFLQEAPDFLKSHGAKDIALMLGNEKNGLSEEELSFAHLCVSIESSLEQPSLNLSHAAAVVLHTLVQVKESPFEAAGTEDIQRACAQMIRLLDTAEYFEQEDKKKSFTLYLQKILTRGIRQKEDSLVVENLLRRLTGIMKRKSGGK